MNASTTILKSDLIEPVKDMNKVAFLLGMAKGEIESKKIKYGYDTTPRLFTRTKPYIKAGNMGDEAKSEGSDEPIVFTDSYINSNRFLFDPKHTNKNTVQFRKPLAAARQNSEMYLLFEEKSPSGLRTTHHLVKMDEQLFAALFDSEPFDPEQSPPIIRPQVQEKDIAPLSLAQKAHAFRPLPANRQLAGTGHIPQSYRR